MGEPKPEGDSLSMGRGWAFFVAGAAGLVPLLAYPGNWANALPSTAASVADWRMAAVLDYLGVLGSVTLFTAGLVLLVRAWSVQPPSAGRIEWVKALAQALVAKRNRKVLLVSSVAYAALFVTLTGLVGVALHGDVRATGFPSVTEFLCCGPVGITPGLVVAVDPYLQISLNPLTLLLAYAGVLLFSLNVTLAIESIRARLGGWRQRPVALAGAFSAFLVGCPSCGTILLVNALEGTAVSGLLLGWSAYQTPLLLVAFPLGVASLVLTARGLSKMRGCLTYRRSLRR
ncbi:MAG: hypothetical protein KGJ23_02160 [Euryarchaeota archaeon]|nr:hypothetical protein [Euryarchaeota archaeon]MDE1835400.1 hypothetical protein [Euryarchaeota archaeon]MDE1882262.1 hypothetical protein [Euryarchaeota archaeon]MDE2043696.1 hypothetical protein [Thermoplasmata archaeon]